MVKVIHEDEFTPETTKLFTKPVDIAIGYFGPGLAKHNMPCAIHPEEHAVLDTGSGVFEPSWKAQEEGWALVQIRPGRMWLFELLQKFALISKPMF